MFIPVLVSSWQTQPGEVDDLTELIIDTLSRLRIPNRIAAQIQGIALTQWSDQLYGRAGAHISLRRFLQMPPAFHRVFWPRLLNIWFGWDLEWRDETGTLSQRLELPLRAQPSTLKAALPLKEKQEDVS